MRYTTIQQPQLNLTLTDIIRYLLFPHYNPHKIIENSNFIPQISTLRVIHLPQLFTSLLSFGDHVHYVLTRFIPSVDLNPHVLSHVIHHSIASTAPNYPKLPIHFDKKASSRSNTQSTSQQQHTLQLTRTLQSFLADVDGPSEFNTELDDSNSIEINNTTSSDQTHHSQSSPTLPQTSQPINSNVSINHSRPIKSPPNLFLTTKLNRFTTPLHRIFETSHVFDERWFNSFVSTLMQTIMTLLISQQIQVISSQQQDTIRYTINSPTPTTTTTTPNPLSNPYSTGPDLHDQTPIKLSTTLANQQPHLTKTMTQLQVLLEVIINIAIISWLYIEVIRTPNVNPTYKDFVDRYVLYSDNNNHFLLNQLQQGHISFSTFQPNSFYDDIGTAMDQSLNDKVNQIVSDNPLNHHLKMTQQPITPHPLASISNNHTTTSNQHSQINQQFNNKPMAQSVQRMNSSRSFASKKQTTNIVTSTNNEMSMPMTTKANFDVSTLTNVKPQTKSVNSSLPPPTTTTSLPPHTPFFIPPLPLSYPFSTTSSTINIPRDPRVDTTSTFTPPHSTINSAAFSKLDELVQSFRYPPVLFPCTSATVHIAAHYVNLIAFPIIPINHVFAQHLFDIDINDENPDLISLTRSPTSQTHSGNPTPPISNSLQSISSQHYSVPTMKANVTKQDQPFVSLGLLLRTWQRHLVKSAPSLIFPPLPIPVLSSYIAIPHVQLTKALLIDNFAKQSPNSPNDKLSQARKTPRKPLAHIAAHNRLDRVINSSTINTPQQEYSRLRRKVAFFLNKLQLSSDINCLVSPLYTLQLEEHYRDQINSTNHTQNRLKSNLDQLHAFNLAMPTTTPPEAECATSISNVSQWCPCYTSSSDSDEASEDDENDDDKRNSSQLYRLKQVMKESESLVFKDKINTAHRKNGDNDTHRDKDGSTPSNTTTETDHDDTGESQNDKNPPIDKTTHIQHNKLEILVVPDIVVRNYLTFKKFVDFSPVHLSQLSQIKQSTSVKTNYSKEKQHQFILPYKYQHEPLAFQLDVFPRSGPYTPSSITMYTSQFNPSSQNQVVSRYLSPSSWLPSIAHWAQKFRFPKPSANNLHVPAVVVNPLTHNAASQNSKVDHILTKSIIPERLHVLVSLLPTSNPNISALHMCFDTFTDPHVHPHEENQTAQPPQSHFCITSHQSHISPTPQSTTRYDIPCVTIYQYQYNQHTFNIQYMIIHVLLTLAKTVYKNDPIFLSRFNPYYYFANLTKNNSSNTNQMSNRQSQQSHQGEFPLSFSFSIHPPHLQKVTSPNTEKVMHQPVKAPLPPQQLLSLLTLHLFQYCYVTRLFLTLMSVCYSNPELHVKHGILFNQNQQSTQTDSPYTPKKSYPNDKNASDPTPQSKHQSKSTKLPFSFPFSLSASPCLLIFHFNSNDSNHEKNSTTAADTLTSTQKHQPSPSTSTLPSTLELDCLMDNALFYSILYPQINLPTTLEQRRHQQQQSKTYYDSVEREFGSPLSSKNSSQGQASIPMMRKNTLYPFDDALIDKNAKSHTGFNINTNMNIPIMTFKSQYPRKLSSQFFTTDVNSLVRFASMTTDVTQLDPALAQPRPESKYNHPFSTLGGSLPQQQYYQQDQINTTPSL